MHGLLIMTCKAFGTHQPLRCNTPNCDFGAEVFVLNMKLGLVKLTRGGVCLFLSLGWIWRQVMRRALCSIVS